MHERANAEQVLLRRRRREWSQREPGEDIYAAAMLAFSTGKQVSVLFDDASSFCYVSAIVVTD
jgi:hypothetical protein